MSINIKEAAQIAVSAVTDLFDEQSISNVMFEEVDKQGWDWLITVGFDRVVERNSLILGGVLGAMNPTERKYKVVKIDTAGDVVSVKDRMLEKK